MSRPHLLVTNDFPPKTGGIQSYLWELWRRLPAETTTVLTTPYAGAAEFDRAQPFRVERTRERVLLPTASLRRRVDDLAAEVDADLVLLDPALPVGLLGPTLERPFGLVVHGAEVAIPGRLPGTRGRLGRLARQASLVIAAGGYPAAELARVADRELGSTTVVVPPGVDPERFHPVGADERLATRERFGLAPDALVVLGLSRLVPRKGFDRVIDAVARLAPDRPELVLAIAGAGRDRARLERRAVRREAPVRFLGRVSDDDLPRLHAVADVFAMLCRNRWLGLEQEGFGIVFLEAAACGVPQLAGASGGAHEAVVDGVTGTVLRRPRLAGDAARALAALLDHPERRARLGHAGCVRVQAELSYDVLAGRLAAALDAV